MPGPILPVPPGTLIVVRVRSDPGEENIGGDRAFCYMGSALETQVMGRPYETGLAVALVTGVLVGEPRGGTLSAKVFSGTQPSDLRWKNIRIATSKIRRHHRPVSQSSASALSCRSRQLGSV